MQPYTSTFLKEQAQRTAPTRQFFYQNTKWREVPICIDIGCGTGVITPEFTNEAPGVSAIGLDIDPILLSKAVRMYSHNGALHFLLADAAFLPLRQSIANFCLSHFTMMWISERIKALKEIRYVLRPKGVFASIEPDYAERIEIPEGQTKPLPDATYPIIEALQELGADPYTGSHLPSELEKLGFQDIRSGILSWQFDAKAMKAEITEEAALLKELGFHWVVPKFIYTPIWWIIATSKRG
ncbi:MAG: class I SAM-dependent methyltransferase [Candidatus Hermodarchaeota archaeon]